MTTRTSNIFVTVDAVVFKRIDHSFKVLLIKRANNPFKDSWALPGGFVDHNEDIDQAAARELFEETQIKNVDLHQFRTFGKPYRDPRGHTISVAYWGIADDNAKAKAADDAVEAQWFPVDGLPEIAFDHSDIINVALNSIPK